MRKQHIVFLVIVALLLLEVAMPKPPATRELFDSGVPHTQSELLASIYGDAAQRLKQMVLHPVGSTQSGQDFRQARAAGLVNQVEKIRQSLNQQAGLWVGKNLPQAFMQGKRRADQQAREAGIQPKEGQPLGGSFSLVDQRAVIVLARETLVDLNKASGAMADRATRLIRTTAQRGLAEKDIDSIISRGIILGDPRAAVADLRKELIAVHGETVPIVDKNGDTINFEAKHYAELVVRTKTRAATVIARHERLQEVGIDLVAIVGRISKNFCTAFLGQVFSLSGKSDKYPAYASLPGGGPPFHPFCSKSTRPFVAELASKKELEQADGVDDADKLLEMKPDQAQRAFQDLQIYQQQKDRYATTEKKLFS